MMSLGTHNVASRSVRIFTNSFSLMPMWAWTLPSCSAAAVVSQAYASRPAAGSQARTEPTTAQDFVVSSSMRQLTAFVGSSKSCGFGLGDCVVSSVGWLGPQKQLPRGNHAQCHCSNEHHAFDSPKNKACHCRAGAEAGHSPAQAKQSGTT